MGAWMVAKDDVNAVALMFCWAINQICNDAHPLQQRGASAREGPCNSRQHAELNSSRTKRKAGRSEDGDVFGMSSRSPPTLLEPVRKDVSKSRCVKQSVLSNVAMDVLPGWLGDPDAPPELPKPPVKSVKVLLPWLFVTASTICLLPHLEKLVAEKGQAAWWVLPVHL